MPVIRKQQCDSKKFIWYIFRQELHNMNVNSDDR